jgi:hypothetical protein
MIDQLVAEALPTKKYNIQTFMPSEGFDPAIQAMKWPQTYALDRTATDNGQGSDRHN